MKKIVIAVVTIILFSAGLFTYMGSKGICEKTPAVANSNDQELSSYLVNLPFQMPQIQVPHFSNSHFCIKDYGAVGDGLKKNTDAFAEAIMAAANAGGGTVIVPPGNWLTGPISLKSNVNLHLESGAIMNFSKDHNDYPLIKGKGDYTVVPLIYAVNLTNIGITGDGVINGSGETWRPVKKSKLSESQWKSLISSGGVVVKDVWWPSQQAADGETYLEEHKNKKLTEVNYQQMKDYLRPDLIDIENSKSVLIDGPMLENSPKFNLNVKQCEDVVIRNLKVNNEWYAQNTDGMDINGKNIIIYRNTINTGDDGITMKSSKDKTTTDNDPGLQNVIIEDNIVNRAHGGFVVGSNTDGGMRNIYVHNNIFSGTDTGLRFKSNVGIGGLVQNIWIDDITMKDITSDAIAFDMSYNDNDEQKNSNLKIKKDNVPQFNNIYINHVYVDGADHAINIQGTNDVNVGEIDIQNSVFQSNQGFTSNFANGIKLNNVTIRPKTGPEFNFKNSKNIFSNGKEILDHS